MERLIINADDFGLTAGVNRGIIECYRHGTLTSATLMVTAAAAADAARMATENPGLGVGLHLNLTSGKPVLPAAAIASLVDRRGEFPGKAQALARLTTGRARTSELEAEIAAQAELSRKLGISPTHVDSHHHAHLHPRLRAVLQRICPDLGITRIRGYHVSVKGVRSAILAALYRLPPAGSRLETTDLLCGVEIPGEKDLTTILEPFLGKAGGTAELMCHPGYSDSELAGVTSYSGPRERELASLLSEEFKRLLSGSGVRTISYRDL
jgi:predicted glycoside hydrolase/deacetylase ChbG (UPF0249 family)